MAINGTETEIKVRVADIAALRRQLARLHAKAQPRVLERNTLYDTSLLELRETGRLLRIRTHTPSPIGRVPARPARLRAAARTDPGSHAVLTYKAPPTPSIVSSTRSRYKENQELEIAFQPAHNLEAILAALGLAASFRYEKFRTSYRLRSIPGLHLDLDETPIGDYLELEGSPASIDRAARLLSFSPQDYIAGTYWDLYLADCRGRNITPTNLVFSQRKK